LASAINAAPFSAVAMQIVAVRGRHAPAGMAKAGRQGTQRIEDHGNVDHLLNDGRRDRHQPAEAGRQHRQH
jgi:hypothetical protein